MMQVQSLESLKLVVSFLLKVDALKLKREVESKGSFFEKLLKPNKSVSNFKGPT